LQFKAREQSLHRARENFVLKTQQISKSSQSR